MKARKQILSTALLGLTLVASSQQLDRQVIASAGSNATNSFTIGEVIVSSSNLEITAGFQQPSFIEDETPALGTRDITQKLMVYPVPTRDELTIKGNDLFAETTHLQFFSSEGKIINLPVHMDSSSMKLDLTGIPSGNYYLILTDPTQNTIAKYKIFKIK